MPGSWSEPLRRRTGKSKGAPAPASAAEECEDLTGDDTNTGPVAFLAAKASLKKAVSAEKRNLTAKGWIGKQLPALIKQLNASHLQELATQGDIDGLLRHYEKGAKSFDEMLSELSDLDPASLDGFKTRFEGAVTELAKHAATGEAMLANAQYLFKEKLKAERGTVMKARYNLARTSKMFAPTFGDKFAKVIAEARIQEQGSPVPVTSEREHFDHSSMMLFQTGTPAGDSVITAIRDYIAYSSSPVSSKLESLKTFLASNPARPTASCPVKVHYDDGRDNEAVPDLSVCLGIQERMEYEDMQGASPWLVCSRSLTQRMGPGGCPLPGFGCLIYPIEGSIIFYMVPIKCLVEAGQYSGLSCP